MRVIPIRTLALCTLIIASMVGCDSGGDNDPGVEGTYQLVSMSGFDEDLGDQTYTAGQPTTITQDGFSLTVTVDGAMTLTASETFTMNLSISVVAPGLGGATENITASGSYTASGNTVVLSGTAEGEAFNQSATLDGDRLTLTDDGATIIFER